MNDPAAGSIRRERKRERERRRRRRGGVGKNPSGAEHPDAFSRRGEGGQ